MSYGNIFPPYKTEKLVAGLNKMNLDPTPNELVNLPQESVDDLAGGLNHDVAEQHTKWKNTEAKKLRKMEKDVGRLKAKNEELNRNKKRLRKKLDYTRQELDHTRQELDQTRERLANSRDEYIVIKKELERVREELMSTQVQLDKRSTLSTSHEAEKVLEEARA